MVVSSEKTNPSTSEERYQRQVDAGVFGKPSIVVGAGPNRPNPRAAAMNNFTRVNTFSLPFNGEKNLGELGPIKSYLPDWPKLRLRSWQLYLESEVAQTILGKFETWTIGKGLKLQAEPNKDLLMSLGIDLDTKKFSKSIETRFAAWAKSKRSDYSKKVNYNTLQAQALKNAIIGGDVLVIMRYDGKNISIQLIDGANVVSPLNWSSFFPTALANGNIIKDGIEVSPTGEHVAYYVRKPGLLFETERVAAYGEISGLRMAFMVYGLEYRLDSVRGLPMLSVVFETIKKLERYKEATVGSAEERQKIVYYIKHGVSSDGSSPLMKEIRKARSQDGNTDEIPIDVQGNELANTIAATTNKQTFNMTQDSELDSLESKNELYFKEFYSVNAELICSSIGIPPDVAFSNYKSNYSSSRAAIKDWEHSLNVRRAKFAQEFCQPIYDFFLYIEANAVKIQAPGYIKAVKNDDYLALEAYSTARFVGAQVPHIDPLKEVQAERAKLGDLGINIPLTTVEQATENLNGGDSAANMVQFSEELEESKKLGLKPDPIEVVPAPAPANP